METNLPSHKIKLHSVPPVNDFSGKEDVRSSIAFNVSDEF